jgi:diacylglycerol O-acyltransferase / wax synthase
VARLSTIDAFWMNAQKEGPPFAIGALLVMEGPAPSLHELRTLIAGRTTTAERMRQRLESDTLRLRQAEWVADAPDFGHHVREVAVESPGDQPALERAVADIMRQGMARDRPLWDMTLLSGLAEGSWAVVSRLHHTVADGQGALMLTGRIIDADPEGRTSLTDALDVLMAGRPKPDPDDARSGSTALIAEAAKRGGDLVVRALRTASSASATTQAVGSAAGAVSRSAGAMATQLPGPAGALAGAPGERRAWTTTTVAMADVKRIRTSLGGTVNDVVMCLMSGGYRCLLAEMGIDPEPRTVRVLVPVSLRSPGDLASNNQVSGLLVVLPLAGDAASRYADLRAHLDAVKDLGTMALAGPVFESIDRTVPAFVQTLVVRAFTRPVGAAFSETLVTNVPGPPFPVYVGGRPVHSIAPIIPVGEPWRLNTGIFSYQGHLHFGLTGGEGIEDAVHVVARGVHEALAELLEAAASAEAGQ